MAKMDHFVWIESLVIYLSQAEDDEEALDYMIASEQDWSKLTEAEKKDVFIYLLGAAVRRGKVGGSDK